MKNILKVAFFSFFFLLGQQLVFAQKHCDLELTIIAPSDGAEIPYGDTAFLQYSIKNLGPDTVDSTDTLYINLAGDPYSRVITPNIAVGDTVNDRYLYAWNDNPADDTMNFCLFLMTGLNTSITDSVPDNDSSCVTFILKGSGTGIAELHPTSPKALTLYPNPAHTEVTLSADLDKTENVMISVKDIRGRICLEKDIEQWKPSKNKSISIDISSLKTGIYLVELKTKETRWMGKLIVE